MSNQFSNKIVAITGGSDGIGKALVEKYLQAGAKVATCGRNAEKLKLLGNHNNLLTIVADVAKQEDCKHFIAETKKKFGKIDILINNAGISMRGHFNETHPDVLIKLMEINYFGVVYCTHYAINDIIENKGSVVGISSIAGFRGLPGRSGYSASKFALNGFLESLRTEMLPHDVHVLTACPGFTKSNIRNTALNKDGNTEGESPLDESSLMTAEETADEIIAAIKNRKRTLVLTFKGKQTVFMNKYFPSLTDKLTYNFFYKNGKLVK